MPYLETLTSHNAQLEEISAIVDALPDAIDPSSLIKVISGSVPTDTTAATWNIPGELICACMTVTSATASPIQGGGCITLDILNQTTKQVSVYVQANVAGRLSFDDEHTLRYTPQRAVVGGTYWIFYRETN